MSPVESGTIPPTSGNVRAPDALLELQIRITNAQALRLDHSLVDADLYDEALLRTQRRSIADAIKAVSTFLSQVIEMEVGEGEGDLLGTEPDEVDGLGEFAHFRGLRVALQLGGLAGAGGDVRPGFFECLAARLHGTSPVAAGPGPESPDAPASVGEPPPRADVPSPASPEVEGGASWQP